MPAREVRRRRTLALAVMRRPAARLAVRAAAHVAARAVAEKLLAAALLARPKAILTTARLPDREVWRRPLRRRLPLGARQRRANQRTMDWTLFGGILDFVNLALTVIWLGGLIGSIR